MSARGSFSINDGESTPVSHTFTPDGDVGPGHLRFINRNAGVPAASEYVFCRVTKSNSALNSIQAPKTQVNPDVFELRVKYPATYTDSATGLTLVDFIDESQVKRMTHPRSSEQRRKNLRTLTVNAVAVGMFVTAWDKAEAVW